MALKDFEYIPHGAFIAPVKLPNLQIKESFERKSDVRWKRIAQDWRDTKEQLKLLEEKERDLRDELIEMSNGRNCFGNGIQVSKITKKGNIQYDAIPQLKEIDLDQYRKESSDYWKITEMV